MYSEMTAILNKCMEVLYILIYDIRRVLIDCEVYITKTYFSAGGEW